MDRCEIVTEQKKVKRRCRLRAKKVLPDGTRVCFPHYWQKSGVFDKPKGKDKKKKVKETITGTIESVSK